MKDFAGERGMSMEILGRGHSWHLGYIVTLTSPFSFSSSLVNEAEMSETDYTCVPR